MRKSIKLSGFLGAVALSMIVFFSSFMQEEWKQIYNQNGINISSRKADCDLEKNHKQRWILLKIQNTTSNKLKVEWNEELSFNGGPCATCNSDEYHKSIEIAPNETLEGKCTFETPGQLRIVARLLDAQAKSEVSDFKLANIKVTEIK